MNKVAVIMSVYRSDNLEYLKLAVDSILNQSYQEIVLYIHRDGIVSDSIDQFLSSLSSSKVIYNKSNENKGLASSLNSLIDLILLDGSFTFIARMDSDDISVLNRIESQVNFFVLNPDVDVCGTFCREFGGEFALENKQLPLHHNELLDFSITRCPFIHPSVMFRTQIFLTGIRYPIDTSLSEDMALWFLLLYRGYKFGNINSVLIHYRLNENTITRRLGFSKAISEIKLRLLYMFLLKRFSIKNFLLISTRFFFHMMPVFLVKYAYKNLR